MKKCLVAVLLAPMALFASVSGDTTNTFVTVDQNGKMNVRGVATVEDVATNAVRVQVAEARLAAVEAALEAAQEDANALAASIVSNNVTIYRSGHSEGFSAVVVITPEDKLACVSVKRISYTGTTATFEFKYVCLADITSVTPTLKVHDTLEGGTDEFETVPAANVTTPQYHADPVEVGDVTYAGYYSVTFTQTLAADPTTYFVLVEVDGEGGGAEGEGINLRNGVAGGLTGTIGGGWGLLVRGGVITGVVERASSP